MTLRYEELYVTKDIKEFIADIYRVTAQFPKHEQYALTSQLRRAAFSVLLNIAEGSARRTPKEFSKFITYSLGSLAECHAALGMAEELTYCDAVTRNSLSLKIEFLWKRLCALRNSQK